MLFTSPEFFLLLGLTFLLYYLPFLRKSQVYLLIVSSFIFYAAHLPILLLLLIFSIAINLLSSYAIAHYPKQYHRLIAGLGVASNLGLLAFFKYGPLIGRSFFPENSDAGLFLLSIPLPIGISFFTFQGISLVLDTYRSDPNGLRRVLVKADFKKHLFRTSLFISFFPQLVAGPIVKAQEFYPQIREKYLRDIDWEYCFKQLVLGYFLKMVIADNLKDHTFWISYPYFEAHSSITLVALLFAYSMQIFADFAGYSLIAMGIAGLFAYRLPVNFNFPYLSRSFAEFWRRWHISLSSFLKEYLYISLGGNRKGRWRTYLNLMLTMVLGGLWHGAAWSYAVWGAYHGLALALERFLQEQFPFRWGRYGQLFKGLGVFLMVSLGWLLFKLPDFREVIKFLLALRYNILLRPDSTILINIFLYTCPIIFYHLVYIYKEKIQIINRPAFQALLYAGMLFLIVFNAGSAHSFIYFQF